MKNRNLAKLIFIILALFILSCRHKPSKSNGVANEDVDFTQIVLQKILHLLFVKPGAVFYTYSSCTTPMTEEYPVGPLWIQGVDEERHIWKLEGLSGLIIYINDPDALEMFQGLGRSRNSREG